MTYAEATQYWNALTPDQKQVFYNYASKSEGNHTAFEWFNHLVPDSLKDDPQEIETFMDGGTIVTTDGEVIEIPDKDLSRIQSGENGGEYTTDNTIMEDASDNRSRGSADMTDEEFEVVEATNNIEAEVIDGADFMDYAGEPIGESVDVVSEVFGAGADIAADALAPLIGAAVAGTAVANQCDSDVDKLGYGALAAGGGALLCLTPPGQLALGAYCAYKLTYRVCGWLGWGK